MPEPRQHEDNENKDIETKILTAYAVVRVHTVLARCTASIATPTMAHTSVVLTYIRSIAVATVETVDCKQTKKPHQHQILCPKTTEFLTT